ncbi:MAG: NADH-quinone oxidoreductase subunit L [Bacteroidota bacterium]
MPATYSRANLTAYAALLEHFLRILPDLVTRLVLIALLLPLLAAILLGLGPRSRNLSWVAALLMLLTFGLCSCSLVATYNGAFFHSCLTWFRTQAEPLPWVFPLGIYVDFVAATMLCLVSLISFVVYLYSIPYLKRDPGIQRYFTFLSFFVGVMLWLVVADSLLGIFVGWELVGCASYLLIGFWYQQVEAAQASTTAWLTNKPGSVLFLVGLLLIGSELGSLSLVMLPSVTPAIHYSNSRLTVAGLCLLAGVFTKSAQLPFFSWLPRAMTAPTPASALLHAATLVSAGVYLLARATLILSAELLTIVALVGSMTAFMGAYAALAQQHIKRMLAYSTISQLGYVMMAIGIQAAGAGLFHLVMHAFFKACLFLCAGAVSYYLGQQGIVGAATQTMRNMGGLGQAIPWIFGAYLIASLALVGMPGFSGFVSKEAILAHTLSWAMEHAQNSHYLSYVVPILGFATSLLTVIYIGRSCFLIFMRAPQWRCRPAIGLTRLPRSTLPLLMQLSIMALALCSLGLYHNPLSFNFNHNWLLQRLETAVAGSPTTLSLAMSQSIQHAAASISIAILLIGMLVLVISLYLATTRLHKRFQSLAHLSLHGWYLAAITSLVARKLLSLSKLVARLEQKLVHGAINCLAISYVVIGNIIAWLDSKLVGGTICLAVSVFRWLGRLYGHVQNGNLQRYLLWTCIGAGLLLVWWLY